MSNLSSGRTFDWAKGFDFYDLFMGPSPPSDPGGVDSKFTFEIWGWSYFTEGSRLVSLVPFSGFFNSGLVTVQSWNSTSTYFQTPKRGKALHPLRYPFLIY